VSAIPPKLKKMPHQMEMHGHVRNDEYFWLNNRSDPAVTSYLEAENVHTDAVLSPVRDLKQRLLAEMKGRIKEDEESAPYRDGNYYYYLRYEKGREYPVYCRKCGSLDAPEQVLLDVNAVAAEHDYCAVRNFSVTPDHSKAAFAVDFEGRRFYELRFLDLDNGQLLSDQIVNVSENFEWANDSNTLFYTRQDEETLRDYQVYRYGLGDIGATLVYQEDDDSNWLSVEKSLSGKFLFLASVATLSTEIHYLSASHPEQEPKLFLQREEEHEYFVTDGMDCFYVLSNDGAQNFKLSKTPIGDTAKESWQDVMANRDTVLIEGLDVFGKFIVLSVVENGLSQLEVLSRESGDLYRIPFDEDVCSVCSGDNFEYDSILFRYSYESMTTPESIYDFNLITQGQSLIKEQEVPGEFNRADYRTERLFAPARDGTQVPVSLVYKAGLRKTGTNPLLVYGYGSYGISMEPEFDSDLLSLLDRGFVYAIAHVRGGSEMGRQWYIDGRQLKKMNSFNDFIDVTQFLIEEGFSTREHTYAQGGSAGGLLVAAVANMAPDLYQGIIADVPFVDIVTTMLDSDIPLTTGEWDEWGNPEDKKYYEYMLSYSPYDNVKSMEYPNLLVTTGLQDSQVQYWEPAKWVAKLRDHKTDDKLLLFKTDMAAGHSGKTGRYQSLEETSLCYSFLLLLEGTLQ
jgi:oligopeptidase B